MQFLQKLLIASQRLEAFVRWYGAGIAAAGGAWLSRCRESRQLQFLPRVAGVNCFVCYLERYVWQQLFDTGKRFWRRHEMHSLSPTSGNEDHVAGGSTRTQAMSVQGTSCRCPHDTERLWMSAPRSRNTQAASETET